MIIFFRGCILSIMTFFMPYISKNIQVKDLETLKLDIYFSFFICLYTIANYFIYKKITDTNMLITPPISGGVIGSADTTSPNLNANFSLNEILKKHNM